MLVKSSQDSGIGAKLTFPTVAMTALMVGLVPRSTISHWNS